MNLKRISAAVLAMLALSFPARADTAVNGKHVSALVASDGTEILSAGAYVRIVPLKQGFWCGTDAQGKAWLLDAAGGAVSDEKFDALRCTGDAILFQSGGAWGILSDDGSVFVPAKYSDIRSNGEGDFIAVRASVGAGSAQTVDFVDASGSEYAVGVRVLYGLNDFSEGLMPVLLAKTGRYGYLDTQGVSAFGAEYTAVSAFQDGYAVVSDENGTGMINQMGKVVVPLEYDTIQRMGDLALLTRKGGGMLVLKIGGDILLEVSGTVSTGVIGRYGLIWQPDGMRLLDETGVVLSRFEPSVQLSAGLGEQVIVSDGAWGEACVQLCAADGTPVGEKRQSIQPMTEADGALCYAVAEFPAVPVKNAAGEVLCCDWNEADIRYALMDGAGNLLTDFRFTYLCPAGDGLMYAWTETQTGLIDAYGTFVWTAPEDFPVI